MLETNEFINGLKTYQVYTNKILEDNLKVVCDDILTVAKHNAPRDTGNLDRESGYYVKNLGSELIGYIGFMPFYAVYTHQGTGIHALNGDGRKTPWSWFGTTEKWAGWHTTTGQKPKQYLKEALINNVNSIPYGLERGL